MCACACPCEHHLHADPEKPEEGVRSPGTEVTDPCELPDFQVLCVLIHWPAPLPSFDITYYLFNWHIGSSWQSPGSDPEDSSNSTTTRLQLGHIIAQNQLQIKKSFPNTKWKQYSSSKHHTVRGEWRGCSREGQRLNIMEYMMHWGKIINLVLQEHQETK